MHPSRISIRAWGVGEPGFGVEAIEAAGCDRGVGAGPDAERIPGACEEGVSLGWFDGLLDVLDRVGVDVELAVLEEAAEAGPGIVGEAVSDGGGFDRGLGEVFGGGLQEAVPFLECGFQRLLPVAEALIGWLALDGCFEGKQGSDPPQGGVPEAGGGQVVDAFASNAPCRTAA